MSLPLWVAIWVLASAAAEPEPRSRSPAKPDRPLVPVWVPPPPGRRQLPATSIHWPS